MSYSPIKGARIVCDSCGKYLDFNNSNATSARIAASVAGWKYVTWDIKGMGYQVRSPRPGTAVGFRLDTVPKQWDCCPDCLPPESPLDAKAIREEREAVKRDA